MPVWSSPISHERYVRQTGCYHSRQRRVATITWGGLLSRILFGAAAKLCRVRTYGGRDGFEEMRRSAGEMALLGVVPRLMASPLQRRRHVSPDSRVSLGAQARTAVCGVPGGSGEGNAEREVTGARAARDPWTSQATSSRAARSRSRTSRSPSRGRHNSAASS